MAVSQEYLAALDKISAARNFEQYEVDQLLHELCYGWSYLQSRYPTYKQGFNTYQASIAHALFENAELAYELLARLTGENFYSIIIGAKELHSRKNSGYSPSDTDAWANFRECTKFGIDVVDGVITRLCDKWTRFNNVYSDSSKDKVGESAIDTLRDFAAYSLIAVMLMNEKG